MNSFWKFVGGMIVGAAAAHLINEQYKKRNQVPPPVTETKPQSKSIQVDEDIYVEINMIEDLIKAYESKKNRNTRDNNTLDLLRIKLKQLQH